MFISGSLEAVYGLAAIFSSDWVVFSQRELLVVDLTGWGWVHLILGVIVVLSGIAVFVGNVAARTVAVVLAALSLLTNFVSLPAYPFWSLVIIAMDICVIWALIVHGHELRDPA